VCTKTVLRVHSKRTYLSYLLKLLAGMNKTTKLQNMQTRDKTEAMMNITSELLTVVKASGLA